MGGSIQAKGPVKEAEMRVVVTRADGTVHDFGVVASTKWHWWSPRAWQAKRRIRRLNLQAGFTAGGTPKED